jgi:uncharacterized protein YndB with AHSA1/START domain
MFVRWWGLAVWLVSAAAAADVQVTPNGFLVQQTLTVQAAPDKVYQALVNQVASWWSPRHTYSGDAGNLSIDARPGGCFCERLPGGGGVEHLRVVYLAPAQVVRMAGALGPLQASGLNSSLTWKLSPSDGQTRLELSYSVGGFMDGGFEKIAPAVDGVLGEQARRLKHFVETGRPAD